MKEETEEIQANSEEQEAEFAQCLQDGQKLESLIKHPGWTEVLKPRFDNLRKNLVQKMLSERLDERGFVLLQQSINALDNIIGGIAHAIEKGKAAAEYFKNKTE